MLELIDKEEVLKIIDEAGDTGEAHGNINYKCNPILTIPNNPTNGDMIKVMFPNIDFYDMAFTVHATTNVTSNGVKGGISYDFWKEWWNAPYREDKADDE